MRKGSIYSEKKIDEIIKEFSWGRLYQEGLAKKLGIPRPTLASITLYYRRRVNPERVGKQIREYLDNAHPLPKIVKDGSEVSKIMSLYIGSDMGQEEIAEKLGLNKTVTSCIIRYFYRRGSFTKSLPVKHREYIDRKYPLTKSKVVRVEKVNTVSKREISILWGLIKIKY